MLNLETYLENNLNEALKVKYVVRKGKRVKKWITTKKGKYRVAYDEGGNPKEVRITSTERRKRKMGQRRAKVKRKAKMGVIELRRKKSFIARRNSGLSYNKKIPDIVASRGPDGHIGGKVGRPEGFRLHPADESYSPEKTNMILFEDCTNTYYWDFCSEILNDSTWLEQIVDVYQKHELVLVENDNQTDCDILEIPDEYLMEITNNLKANEKFLIAAAKDYINANADTQNRFMNHIPAVLFNSVLHYINEMNK